MKKIISIILALFIMAVPSIGCDNGEDAVLTLSQKSITLSLAGEADLIASYQGIDSISWKNSDSNVITMTVCGNYVKLVAVGEGSARVKVSGGGKSAECLVIVKESAHTTSVSIDRDGDVNISQGAKIYLPVSAYFMGEKVKADITYSVKDSAIATISESGEITGVSVGETEVYVQAEYNGIRSPKKSVKVNVKSGAALILSATHFDLYEYDANVSKNYFPNKAEFEAYIVDGQTVVKDVEFTFNNKLDEIATFKDGVVTGVSAGQTEITVTCEYNGQQLVGTIYVSVQKVPTISLSLNTTKAVLFCDPISSEYPVFEQLNATFIVDGRVLSVDMNWAVEAGNTAATVNASGYVRAIGIGKAVITASYTYCGTTYKAKCNVEVVSNITYRTLTADVNNDGANDINKDMIFAYLTADNNSFTINNVNLTQTTDTDLIRFGVPNYNGEISKIFRVIVRFTDVNDSNNWIEGIFSFFNNGATGGITAHAVNTSTWTLNHESKTLIGLGYRKVNNVDTIKPMESVNSRSYAKESNLSGANFSDSALKFFMPFTETDYTRNMVAFSVVNDEIFLNFNHNSSNPKWKRVSTNMFSKEMQSTLLASGDYQNPVWAGFSTKGVSKVNITVTAIFHDKTGVSPMIIDTLGGAEVTASKVSDMQMVVKG